MTKGDKTRLHIFNTAMALFDEKGYDKVTVSEIVKAAGIAKGTFYIYYETKAAVLAEIVYKYDANYEKLAEEFSKDASSRECLRFLFNATVDVTANEIGWDKIRVFYANQLAGVVGDSENRNRSLYRIVSEQLERGKTCGEFKSECSTDMLTDLLLTWIRGAFFEWITSQGKRDFGLLCRQIVDLFCDSIS